MRQYYEISPQCEFVPNIAKVRCGADEVMELCTHALFHSGPFDRNFLSQIDVLFLLIKALHYSRYARQLLYTWQWKPSLVHYLDFIGNWIKARKCVVLCI